MTDTEVQIFLAALHESAHAVFNLYHYGWARERLGVKVYVTSDGRAGGLCGSDIDSKFSITPATEFAPPADSQKREEQELWAVALMAGEAAVSHFLKTYKKDKSDFKMVTGKPDWFMIEPWIRLSAVTTKAIETRAAEFVREHFPEIMHLRGKLETALRIEQPEIGRILEGIKKTA